MGLYLHGITKAEFLEIANNGIPTTIRCTEVKEPHGRLIDENEVIKRMHAGAWGAIYELDVRGTPTVIEREGE